jgi:hypothetical protein
MSYALSPLVGIWMGLYYSLPRIRKWARENNIQPTVGEVFDYLATQTFRREDYPMFQKARLDYKLLKTRQLYHTLQALEVSWQRNYEVEDVEFKDGTRICSLLDFPRFRGASWPHNDLIVYLPSNNVVAVMKLSDKRFTPIMERLSVITKGVNPFIGTTFELGRVKLNLIFHRIKCQSKTYVNVTSFQRLATFEELIELCKPAFTSPRYVASVLMGNAPLDLTRCIIARYENYYCLMEFFLSNGRLKSVVREKDWSYNFVFDFEGVPVRAWMFRDSLFDESARPEEISRDSKVNILGLATYGRTSLQAFGTRIYLLALSSAMLSAEPQPDKKIDKELPTVNKVEAELLHLWLRKKRIQFIKRKGQKIRQVTEKYNFVQVKDSLVIGDLARLLSNGHYSIQDLFGWDNGGQPLSLYWAKGGRKSSNAVEEFRSALKFILVMRGVINIPKHVLNKSVDGVRID